jgi:hypothetical protein
VNEESDYVQQFIHKLSEGKVVDIIDELTYEEFKLGLIKWREMTTTSPSGRHLGHSKLLTRLQIINNKEDNINISELILRIYYYITMTAITLGNPLERWTQITTCMIEKVPGLSRIDKLRVIHLYEADYNLILKIMWARKAVWQAQSKNLLNNGQAGSRPDHRSIDVALHKEMKYNYAILTRTPLATIDNDAKSCFDRILCNVAMMVSKYFGVDDNYCKLQSTTLKKSIFKIRTALGDSVETYKHSDKTPIHGTGQGSCASPAMWLLISSFLMDLPEQISNGMEIEDILEHMESIRQIIEGFVDDNSLFTNLKFGDNNLQELIKKAQKDGQNWECLLHTSGGALELSKCFYYILS